MGESAAYEIEHFKSLADYLKHLATLSTGSIVLLAAFLEKIINQPDWKILVAIALIGFVLSVLTSVIAYTILLANSPRELEQKDWPASEKSIFNASLLVTWLAFLAGVISLSIFLIKNLLR